MEANSFLEKSSEELDLQRSKQEVTKVASDLQPNDQQQPECSTKVELNSSGNTNISLQSIQILNDKLQDDEEDIPVPEGVRDCVASFLEESTEREPSDAETLSSHSSDSESGSDPVMENNQGVNWYTEEECTASSQESTDLDGDEVTDNDSSEDSTTNSQVHRQNIRATKHHTDKARNRGLNGTYTVLPETGRTDDSVGNREKRTVHQRKCVQKNRDGDIEEHDASSTLSKRPGQVKSDSRHNSTMQVHHRDQLTEKYGKSQRSQTNTHEPDSFRERRSFKNYIQSELDRKLQYQREPRQNKPRVQGQKTVSETSGRKQFELEHICPKRSDQGQHENDHKYQNDQVNSYSRHNQSFDNSRYERFYENMSQGEYQQRFESVSPKKSVKTQTLKSYTRDTSRERNKNIKGLAKQFVSPFQSLERSFDDRHEQSLSPRNCSNRLRTESVGRERHRDREILSPVKQVQDSSEIYVNHNLGLSETQNMQTECHHDVREHKIISHTCLEPMARTDKRIEKGVISPQNFKQTNRSECNSSSFISSPRYQMTSKLQGKRSSLTAKSIDSPDISSAGNFHQKHDKNKTEQNSNRTNIFMSPLQQQIHHEKGNKIGSGIISEARVSKKVEAGRESGQAPQGTSRQSLDMHDRLQFKSPNKLNQYEHHGMQNELCAKQYYATTPNVDNRKYSKTPVRHIASDYECNARHIASPLHDDTRHSRSKSNPKLKSPDLPKELRGADRPRKSVQRSPSKYQEDTVNSQLISPIQERFKIKRTRSELLTSENLDLLNQSFNDSCINVSQNQSGYNSFLADENNEKITQWLNRLDSSEDSLGKMSITEVDFETNESDFKLRAKQDRTGNESHSENKFSILRSKNSCYHSDLDHQFRNSNENFCDERCRPPSKRFKGINRDDVNEIHKPTTGYITKPISQSIPHRFKGITNKQLKSFLSSDESGLSNLVTIKPKQAYLKELHQNKLDSTGIQDTPVQQEGCSDERNAHSRKRLSCNNSQQMHKFSEGLKTMSSCNRMYADVGMLSPKLISRDRTPRKTPYSTSSRNHLDNNERSPRKTPYNKTPKDYPETQRRTPRNTPFNTTSGNANLTSSANLRRQQSKETNSMEVRVEELTNTNYSPSKLTKETGMQDFKQFENTSLSFNEISERSGHGRSRKQNLLKRGGTSEFEETIHEGQERQNWSRQRNKFTDTASLNEYCEEGGQESCSCDDFKDKHVDLFESFDSVDDMRNKSPNIPAKVRSPYVQSDTKSPSFQSLYRNQSEKLENCKQDSPSVSMAKLKLNTPRSRGCHMVNSPLADSTEGKKSYSENHGCNPESYLKSLPNEFNRVVTDNERHVKQKSNKGNTVKNTQTSESWSEVDSFSNRHIESEKENYELALSRSNNQKVKSKKSLFIETGRASPPPESSSKPNRNTERENCFKLPISPVVQRQQKVIASQRNSASVSAKRIIPSGDRCQNRTNLNKFVERLDADIHADRINVYEIRSSKTTSSKPVSVTSSRQSCQRPESRFVNQFDYAQSTPIHPGVRLRLNETFSTILDYEETEKDQDEEVMLIDE